MERPLATVIVPVYNVEEYLPSCIESIRTQTYGNLQILLVDDGSSDQCGQICDRYAADDPRIQVIHKANGGVGSARNAGLEQARGGYIFFVDGDDLIEPDMVRYALRELESGPYDLCAWGRREQKNGGSYFVGRPREMTFHFRTEPEKARFLCRWFLTSRTGWEVCQRVFRKSVIERYGLRFGAEIFAEDMDFTFRYLLRSQSFRYIPAPLYIYRIRPSSVMQTIDREKQFGQVLRLLNRQRTDLTDIVPYQKFYIYAGVALAAFMGEPEQGETPQHRALQTLGLLKRCEEWGTLLENARLAGDDRLSIKKACGQPFGSLVCGLYQFLLDGNAERYRKNTGAYYRYLRLRNLKRRLLHPGNG